MQSFGAAIPIAGFVPEERHFNQANFKKKNDTPFLLLHGEEDEIVKPQGSKDMQKVLEKAGYASNLIYYKGGHKIPLSAIKHIKNFILNER
jgi:predicted esterase